MMINWYKFSKNHVISTKGCELNIIIYIWIKALLLKDILLITVHFVAGKYIWQSKYATLNSGKKIYTYIRMTLNTCVFFFN